MQASDENSLPMSSPGSAGRERLNTLYREEVASRHQDRVHGEVLLALPMTWQVMSVLLGAVIVTALILLGNIYYARSEVATGSLVPNEGALRVVAQRAGRISWLGVREGQVVRKGTPLIAITTDPEGRAAQGGSVIVESIAAQDGVLAQQARYAETLAATQRSELAAKATGVEHELEGLAAQIQAQVALIDLAQATYEKALPISQRGYVSERDMAVRREGVLIRTQGLQALRQAQAAKLSERDHLRLQAESARIRQLAEAATIENARRELLRNRARASADLGYTLVAPIAGTVSTLAVQTGDYISPDTPALYIMPAGYRLTARLLVSPRSVAFLSLDQIITLSIDGLPIGPDTGVKARITTISAAPVPPASATPAAGPMYVVTAALATDGRHGGQFENALIAGMGITMRVTSERKTLFRWLVNPLLTSPDA